MEVFHLFSALTSVHLLTKSLKLAERFSAIFGKPYVEMDIIELAIEILSKFEVQSVVAF